MGIDYTVYLGPMAVCKVQRVKVKVKATKQCPNASSARNQMGPYCRNCGQMLQDEETESEQDAIDHHQIQDSIGEVLCFPQGSALRKTMRKQGIHVWLPNVRRDPPRDFQPSDGEMNVVTPASIADEKDWFARAFKRELAVLLGIYGEGCVEICWGQIVTAW